MGGKKKPKSGEGSASGTTKITRKHDFPLDGSQWDLSLMGLEEAPVDDLRANNKATKIDLSNNVMVTLPTDFTSLTHINTLDLSKNRLTELPEDFGRLVKLVHLDLYANKLETLPLSFGQLNKLKWLDLKENPLDNELKKVAGECLNTRQCQACAVNVVKLMKGVGLRLDKDREKRQKEGEEEDVRQKLEEDKKKAEKEKKWQKLQNRRARDRESKREAAAPDSDLTQADNGRHGYDDNDNLRGSKEGCRSGSLGFFSSLLKIFLFLGFLWFASALALHVRHGSDYPSSLNEVSAASNGLVKYLKEGQMVQLLQEMSSLFTDFIKVKEAKAV